MQHVGGYLNLLALEEDAAAYDDVLIVLAGESDAARIRAMEAKRAG